MIPNGIAYEVNLKKFTYHQSKNLRIAQKSGFTEVRKKMIKWTRAHHILKASSLDTIHKIWSRFRLNQVKRTWQPPKRYLKSNFEVTSGFGVVWDIIGMVCRTVPFLLDINNDYQKPKLEYTMGRKLKGYTLIDVTFQLNGYGK